MTADDRVQPASGPDGPVSGTAGTQNLSSGPTGTEGVPPGPGEGEDDPSDLTVLAEALLARAELDEDPAALETALAYARRACAADGQDSPAADGPLELAMARCVLGAALALRAEWFPAGAEQDLREAAEAFHGSIGLLPGDAEPAAHVTGRLGVTLAMAAQRDVLRLEDVPGERRRERSELGGRVAMAVGTLDKGWHGMAADDPYRPAVRYWRGIMHAMRFAMLGGSAEDARRGLDDLGAVLEEPELGEAIANRCHVFMALLHFNRSLPEELRVGGQGATLRHFARVMALRIMATPEDARAALAHLDRLILPDDNGRSDGSALRELVTPMRMAATAAGGLDLSTEGLDEALADLGEVAEGDGAGAELKVMHQLLRAARTAHCGSREEVAAAMRSVTETVEGLGEDTPLRDVLQAVLGQYRDATGDPWDMEASAPQEREAALRLLEQVLEEMPDDDPERASTLSRLARSLIRSLSQTYSLERLQRVRELLLAAAAREAADTENDALNQFLLVLVECMQGSLSENPGGPDDIVDRIKYAVTLFPAGHRLKVAAATLLTMVLAQRFMYGGGLEHLDAADYYARRIAAETEESEDSDPTALRTMDWLQALTPLLRNQHELDGRHVEEMIDRLRSVADRLPEEHHLRPRIESDIHALRFARGAFGPEGLDPTAFQADSERFAALIDEMEAKARTSHPDSPYFCAELGVAAFARVHHGFVRRDVRAMNAGLAALAEAYDAAPVGLPLRPVLMSQIGDGLAMRYEITRDRADLTNAIARLEAARRAQESDSFGGFAAGTLKTLCDLYHQRNDERLGDPQRVAEAGLEGLRIRAWRVMLQSDAERAFDAAVAGAGEAAEVALRCVARGLLDSAVEALESGRAMVLHTATTDLGMTSLLREAGYGDLAAEWESALAELVPAPWDASETAGHANLVERLPEARVPSNLRDRVMAAIEGTQTERRLFAAPSIGEIARSLSEAGAAALAYLVPHEDGRGGLAIVVDADGEVRDVRLPRLATGQDSRLAAFARAQRDRKDSEGALRRWRYALDDLCDWAWTAAMEPLTNVLDLTRRRLVLVPVGELGAVPWHAARRVTGNGLTRYACQDAVISYAASARQYVDARRAGHRPWADEPALVRIHGLHWAWEEAETLHRHFYGHGRLLAGRGADASRASSATVPGPASATDSRTSSPATEDTAATPANVLSLLPGAGTDGVTLLHLGCHAAAERRPVDSRLLLAGGEVLRMTDILRQARARPAGGPGGLVVLAACGSDLSSGHHDEALTLTSAFLGAGASGAVGTRWPVDDLPTLLCMTMFHHYLNCGYDDPAVALRAAQLWMLDPRRRVPPALREDLAGLLDETPLHEPESWAAFTYQGR
ncbi:CHAT domain-containing protein [Nonomuraea sp. PA05]|uniref:CHAT domain-containing protein n=1 Tax=Nonomuraea sp. PA05 TaxID=2604466 RepID=UPI0011D6FC82|nr:CHAT domain-containing protein [Nonomuraea sp. PA05]TYB66616.1 CHAT domain-containing protein [Nonomuraea sp. PA05]